MKRTIRILSVCLAFSLLCTVCLYAAPTSSDGNIADKMSNAISEIESPLAVSKERMERESAALIQYNDLIKGMQSITKSKDVYPESYGGAYIDDSGDLVVCITESSDRASATEMVKTLSKNPDVETKVVKYSLNHLKQAKQQIVDVMKEVNEQKRTKALQTHVYSDIISDITAVGVSRTHNIVIVEIYELNEQKINDFKKAFPDINCVILEEGGINSTTVDIWRPGRKLYVADNDSISTGYPVYFTDVNGATQRGFISAGHSFNVVGSDYDYAYRDPELNNILAVPVRSQYGDTVDAALMEITDSNYIMSDMTVYGLVTLVTNSYATVIEGASVCKEGAKTGASYGIVTNADGCASYMGGWILLDDMIWTTALNLKGDSGGVMYSAATYGIIGSMSGSKRIEGSADLTEDTFEYSIVCKVANATNTLNCTVWNY